MSSLVSIIIITYNRAKYLTEAIESVLVQTFSDWELILVDDGSRDNTPEIAEKYVAADSRIKYFRHSQNRGIAKSRNLGLSKSSGKYIAVLDSDDIWAQPDKLKKQVEFLKNHPECVLVSGGVIMIDEDGKEIRRFVNPLDDAEIRRQILFKNPFCHSGVVYSKEVALRVGGYDEKLAVSEDYDLWLKMGKLGKFANLADYLVKYRIHSSASHASSRWQAAKNTKMLIKKYRNDYPGYFLALIMANLRLIFYRFLDIFDGNHR